MRRIDSHQHFWRLARADYGWLTPDLHPLYRDFEPADLARHLAAHGIAASVLVQAAETDAETDFLLALAADTPWIAAVVGWTDFEAAGAPGRIAALARNPLMVGLRPMLQDLADEDYILRPAVRPALDALHAAGLRLDALVRPRHLSRLVLLRQRFPDLRIVVDHGAKPPIAEGGLRPWADDLRAVADDGVTCCKLSGLVTEAGGGWTIEQLRPFVDTILSAFGPHRVMWGSDWPVLELAASYDSWAEATDQLLAGLSADDRAAILGGTAARFYGLEA